MQKQAAHAAVIEDILKPHHSLLLKDLERAAGLVASAVVEQRPPLCRILLPLYRLFQEFRRDLESHLDAQDARLFPLLLRQESGLKPDAANGPGSYAEEISEEVRLLKYGQLMLTGLIDEMRELTQGFTAPHEACKPYHKLLDVLAGIQTALEVEIQMEGKLVFSGGFETRSDRRETSGLANRKLIAAYRDL